jgi:hypothetical protein
MVSEFIGTMPATNLSLLLTANHKTIYNITNFLSTANLTCVIPGSPSAAPINHTKTINGPNVEVHTKKFVNGEGSKIELMVLARGADTPDYTVYATYDQGSKIAVGGKPSPSPLDYFLNNLGSYGIFYLVVTELIVFAYVFYRLLKGFRKEFFEYIVRDMIYVRKLFTYEPLTADIISDKSWNVNIYGKRELKGAIFRRRKKRKLKLFDDMNDYLRVDDFYLKLNERNSYIEL